MLLVSLDSAHGPQALQIQVRAPSALYRSRALWEVKKFMLGYEGNHSLRGCASSAGLQSAPSLRLRGPAHSQVSHGVWLTGHYCHVPWRTGRLKDGNKFTAPHALFLQEEQLVVKHSRLCKLTEKGANS